MKAYLYVISTPLALVKVGASANPKQRVQNLQIGSPVPLTLAGQYEMSDRPTAEAVAAAPRGALSRPTRTGPVVPGNPARGPEGDRRQGDRRSLPQLGSEVAGGRPARRRGCPGGGGSGVGFGEREGTAASAPTAAPCCRRDAGRRHHPGRSRRRARRHRAARSETGRRTRHSRATLARAQARAERQDASAERRAARGRARIEATERRPPTRASQRAGPQTRSPTSVTPASR